jgi:pimeloyl-ACP methyl ester carboxylesterase
MPENYNFITNGEYQLYVRRIQPSLPSKKVCLLFNSRSLCVESSMGISMGSISYGDYLASKGIETFLIDLRGYGKSTSFQEQIFEDPDQITNPLTRQDFRSDIVAGINYVKNLLGNDVDVTLMGFSMLGPIIIEVAKLHPNDVQKIIILNSFGPKYDSDPPSGSKFFTPYKSDKHYSTISLNDIKSRLESAQPEGKNFIEPLWFEEAKDRLIEFHKTFNQDTNSWKLFIGLKWNWGDMSPGGKKIKADVLVVSGQYDIENPLFVSERLYNNISTERKFLRVLPDATHLCIWEKSRHTLYAWTSDFIYGLEPEQCALKT